MLVLLLVLCLAGGSGTSKVILERIGDAVITQGYYSMRMRVLAVLFLFHMTTNDTRATEQNVLVMSKNLTTVDEQFPSRRVHGRTIQRLIGGHQLFNPVSPISIGTNNINNSLDELPWLSSTAANGHEKGVNVITENTEYRKTLADQVAEGKYGLIHRELFKTTPRRPGVLNYLSNFEIPEDDAGNLGGLSDEEIWLSEGHLLVLKGDALNKINKNKLEARIKNVLPEQITTTEKIDKKNAISKPSNITGIRKETNKYIVEIEKVKVKTFSTQSTTTHQTVPTTSATPVSKNPPVSNVSNEKPIRLKSLSPRTYLHKIKNSSPSTHISVNQRNVKSKPIYYEYFDARKPTIHLYDHYISTTPPQSVPIVGTYGVLYIKEQINQTSASNKKRPPPKEYLPSKNEDMWHLEPKIENLRYKPMQEFNREIETIRQTLRYFDNTIPLLDNLPTRKARPTYDFNIDLARIKTPFAPQLKSIHSIVNQPVNDNFRHTTKQNQHANGRPLYYKPAQNYNSNLRDHSLNIELTSANPLLDFTVFTTSKPIYLERPNWYSIKKIMVHDIPNPLIYNNGASGYNQKLYLPSKNSFQAGPIVTKATLASSHGYDHSYILRRPSRLRAVTNHSSQIQRSKTITHLEKDILVNYKHPLPEENSDSEILSYHGIPTKSYIKYHQPVENTNVYFTPRDS
ncbi:uncharacterized protein LOC131680036 [Topomyia yanbarensis]|uniref:uncharacterized protein LOC131680036 n=1 Tax=Topomyia yanbarensis TaxID=2498891 RepID=UPI00273B4EEC|nr:uncharacterized protein LOC131680036 [Topomyia yanbarensis]